MAARKRHTKAAESLYALLQNESGKLDFAHIICETLGADGCKWLDRNVLSTPTKLTAKEKSLAKTFGVVILEEEKRRALELANLLRFYQHRAQLLKDSLSANEAAKMITVSRETVHKRVRQGKMLGILENGKLRVPLCQFDADGPNGLLEGFSSILTELKCSELRKLSWLVLPNRYFDGRTPIQAMRDGEMEAVAIQASALGVT